MFWFAKPMLFLFLNNTKILTLFYMIVEYTVYTFCGSV